jgi:hypothetical protein
VAVPKALVYLGPRFSPDTEVPGMMIGDPQGSWTYYDEDAAHAAEVYRKALEPFAREWASVFTGDVDLWTTVDCPTTATDNEVLMEACRLMGIELGADHEDAP